MTILDTPKEHFKYLSFREFFEAGRSARDVVMNLDAIVSGSRLKAGLSTSLRSATRACRDVYDARDLYIRYLEGRGYVTFRVGNNRLALKDNDAGYIEGYVEFNTSDNTISTSVSGDLAEATVVIDWVKETFGTLGSLIQTAHSLNDRGDPVFSSKYMTNESANLARESFYPWLGVSLADYYKAFMESDESVLVLFGPPGTGKSTFLRSLIVSGNYETYLAYNKKVVETPSLINRFFRSSAKILAYEDIDQYLKSREDGNALMSPILNSSEGVVKHEGKKIVFSTNLPSIDSIDKALLRRGRCFDILQFRELTGDEAANVCFDVGVVQKDWTLKTKWALSEVLAKEVTEQQTINRFGKKVGFV